MWMRRDEVTTSSEAFDEQANLGSIMYGSFECHCGIVGKASENMIHVKIRHPRLYTCDSDADDSRPYFNDDRTASRAMMNAVTM